MGGLQGDDFGHWIPRKTAMQENHEVRLRIGLPDPMQFFRQERRIEKGAGKSGPVHDGPSLVRDSLLFEFENDPDGTGGDLKGFFQGGNTLPITCIEPLHLVERHLGHGAGLVGGTIDGLVVQQHQVAVAGRPYVDFDQVCVKGTGFPDGGEGIFGGVAGGSPMTDAKDGRDGGLF